MGAVVVPIASNIAAAVGTFLAIFGIKLVWSLVSARCDPSDHRNVSVVAYDALRQTAFFVVATIIALQLLASVVVGATGDAPPTLRMLAMGLGSFVFEPPMVNPDCVVGIDYTSTTKIVILSVALSAAVVDKTLQLIPWLRPEALLFGWRCCGKVSSFLGLRDLTYKIGTPFLRYFLSTGLTIVYVRVVRVAIGAIDCTPSTALNGAYALDSNNLVPCFDDENLPIFVLAIITLIAVGVVWPAATVLVLTQRFALQPRCTKRPPWVERCCDSVLNSEGTSQSSGDAAKNVGDSDCSVSVPSELPLGWTEHYSEEQDATYYHNLESNATTWTRPSTVVPQNVRRILTVSANPRSRLRSAGDEEGAGDFLLETQVESPVEGHGASVSSPSALESPSLQQGWEEHFSLEHNCSYYHHPASSQTLWDKPTRARAEDVRLSADVDASGAVLPAGWEEHVDPTTNRTYFHNIVAGQNLWERPIEHETRAAAAAAATAEGVTEAEGEDSERLELKRTKYIPRPPPQDSEAVVVGHNLCLEGDDITVGDENAESMDDYDCRSVCCKHANELGCIPLCWRERLRVDRHPMVVQQRVDKLGGRARAYDVYVDNAFEPRFFWIPALRMYALLLLTALDLGFSGRAPPTVAGAILRSTLSSLVVLVFTVLVLAPCPYHRIDRWNVAKRLALLVLNVVGSATTMALTFVELASDQSYIDDQGKAASDAARARYQETTIALTTTLVVLLPICFCAVLLAFLLSRGTGCCARMCTVCERANLASGRDAAATSDAVADDSSVSIELAGRTSSSTGRRSAASSHSGRSSSFLEQLASFGSSRSSLLLASSNTAVQQKSFRESGRGSIVKGMASSMFGGDDTQLDGS